MFAISLSYVLAQQEVVARKFRTFSNSDTAKKIKLVGLLIAYPVIFVYIALDAQKFLQGYLQKDLPMMHFVAPVLFYVVQLAHAIGRKESE